MLLMVSIYEKWSSIMKISAFLYCYINQTTYILYSFLIKRNICIEIQFTNDAPSTYIYISNSFNNLRLTPFVVDIGQVSSWSFSYSWTIWSPHGNGGCAVTSSLLISGKTRRPFCYDRRLYTYTTTFHVPFCLSVLLAFLMRYRIALYCVLLAAM